MNQKPCTQGNAGPLPSFLDPHGGGGLGAARPWGRSQGNAGPLPSFLDPHGGRGGVPPLGCTQSERALGAAASDQCAIIKFGAMLASPSTSAPGSDCQLRAMPWSGLDAHRNGEAPAWSRTAAPTEVVLHSRSLWRQAGGRPPGWKRHDLCATSRQWPGNTRKMPTCAKLNAPGRPVRKSAFLARRSHACMHRQKTSGRG
ncbi:hypothetical protein GALL_362490 [mine drainage metagenome]|uniref:Uncharacterized protein n=1 Tax=mine drainage metagenome TaxID=410659 RepID=A0A1J5QEH7_9ZZZZ